MTRLEANRELLKLISEYIKKNPDIRFGQALVNVGLIERPNDIFYIESEEHLKKVQLTTGKRKLWD